MTGNDALMPGDRLWNTLQANMTKQVRPAVTYTGEPIEVKLQMYLMSISEVVSDVTALVPYNESHVT